MAETIKNFYNQTITATQSANLIHNNASTLALVKTIMVCNPAIVANTFTIKLDKQVIYDSVPIDSQETVKLENENLVIEASSTLNISNNAASLYALKNQPECIETALYMAIKVLRDGEIFVLYSNQNQGNEAYYMVFDANGAVLKSATQLYIYATSEQLNIADRGDYVAVVFDHSANDPRSATINKSNWKHIGVYQVSDKNLLYHSMAALPGSSTSAFIASDRSYNLLMGIDSGSSVIHNNLTDINNAYDFTANQLLGLNDGHFLVVFQERVSHHCYFIKYDTAKNQLGTVTQWHTASGANSANIVSAATLSNGTFAVLYTDALDNHYPKLAIFNDDMSIAVDAITLRSATTMNFPTQGALLIDPNNDIHIIYYDSTSGSEPYPYQVDIYTANGMPVNSGILFNDLSSEVNQVSFSMNSSLNSEITIAYTNHSNHLTIQTINPNTINATVSGVEVSQ